MPQGLPGSQAQARLPKRLRARGINLAQQPQGQNKALQQDPSSPGHTTHLVLSLPGHREAVGSRGCRAQLQHLRTWQEPHRMQRAPAHAGGNKTETQSRFDFSLKTRPKQINIARNKWHRRLQFSLRMTGKKAVLVSEMPTHHFCCQVKQAGTC